MFRYPIDYECLEEGLIECRQMHDNRRKHIHKNCTLKKKKTFDLVLFSRNYFELHLLDPLPLFFRH